MITTSYLDFIGELVLPADDYPPREPFNCELSRCDRRDAVMRALGRARGLACHDWRPRQSPGMASPRVSGLVSGGDFGEPPKSAREPRALRRGGWPAPKMTTSYCDFILNSVANACLHQI